MSKTIVDQEALRVVLRDYHTAGGTYESDIVTTNSTNDNMQEGLDLEWALTHLREAMEINSEVKKQHLEMVEPGGGYFEYTVVPALSDYVDHILTDSCRISGIMETRNGSILIIAGVDADGTRVYFNLPRELLASYFPTESITVLPYTTVNPYVQIIGPAHVEELPAKYHLTKVVNDYVNTLRDAGATDIRSKAGEDFYFTISYNHTEAIELPLAPRMLG